MSLVDLTERLARSLNLSADLMAQLHKGLVEQRTCWVSARPSEVEAPVQLLEDLARQISAEQQQQEACLAQAADSLPNPGNLPADRRRVNVSVLCRHLPETAAHRLAEASKRAVSAANQVRTEQALGDRLLRFSQKAHDGMLQNVAQNLGSANDDVGVYDVQARRVHGTLVGSAPTTGSLIDGRM